MGYALGFLAFAWIVYTLNGVIDQINEVRRAIGDLGVPRISSNRQSPEN